MIAPATEAGRRRRHRNDRPEVGAAARVGRTRKVATAEASHPLVALAEDPFAHVHAPVPAPSTAELADCGCPELCERDHDNE